VVRQRTTDCPTYGFTNSRPGDGTWESKAFFSLPAQRLLMLLCIADGNVARSLPLHHSLVRPPGGAILPSRPLTGGAVARSGGQDRPRLRAAEGLVLYGREHDGTLTRDGHGRFTAVELCLWTRS
jgi:hypothetical protein